MNRLNEERFLHMRQQKNQFQILRIKRDIHKKNAREPPEHLKLTVKLFIILPSYIFPLQILHEMYHKLQEL